MMNAVSKNSGCMFFLYGHGGTGKTFICNALSVVVRSEKVIVINSASSGIVSLLIQGGRIAHSRFGLSIIVHGSSTFSIKQQSPQAELLIEAKLIILDKTPMMHRQILPIGLKASWQDIVHATINSSPLWRECLVMKLHKNMRLQSDATSSNEDEIREFDEWILRIENGEAEITRMDFFHRRAIQRPTNESVIYLNDYLSSLIEEEENVYLSFDSLCGDKAGSEINAEIYSTEFLNTISCSGLPPHELKLKKGVHVILVRNIDQA
ncbi:PREDICTED: uncharacterized protein LOC105953721 [Erythranthe guttata]|uniref:uncharacterized protein LOC105953721 n=1 Tax=Erythranthe guttata TaxID=4155 RepID=UPI00064DF376|nr:PREDICTED: uncharacterized protein LOC105953721 [Erythranthe guttata]|eukprot:XP_012832863.1 PREDICTED: uncharacterized protein LOC105953721 [Erythranthe guttata]